MLDGLWFTFLANGAYIGFFETNVGENRLLISKEVAEEVEVGAKLLLLGKFDTKAREVEVISKGENARGNSFFGIKLTCDELGEEKRAQLIRALPKRPTTLREKMFIVARRNYV